MLSSISSALNPASVAVIGASDNPNKVGGRPIHYLSRFGYKGRVFPINPQRTVVQGLQAFPDLAALDETPEAAIIAVGSNDAIDSVRACAERGVKTAIVMSSGFSEAGEAGRQAQMEMLSIAQRANMRLVGPNAQGIANFSTGAVLNFSTMFMEVAPLDGPIAIISQSGAASVMPYALLREAGMGVRYLAATGNDADLCVSELVRAVACDPEIRLILVYLESLSNPEYLGDAARIARERGASIVLLKAGTSKKGAVAAASHTGSMLGNDGALDSFLSRHGIWRALDIHELVNAAPLYLSGKSSGLGRAVVISHSGAVGVMCADAAERLQLPLTELAPATVAALSAILPDFASANNPLDVTAALLGKGEMFPKVLDAIRNDPQADMLLIGVPVAGPGYDLPALAEEAFQYASLSGKPVVVSAPQASVRAAFHARGLPVFPTETDAVSALAQYAHHQQLQAGYREIAMSVSSPIDENLYGLLDEHASLQLLMQHGIPVVEHMLCGSREDAEAAFDQFGGAVVVKGCAASIPHKSEHGLVHVNQRDVAGVRSATASCLTKLDEMGVREPRVSVAKMVCGLHEFVLGVSVDRILGPLVMIGDGGTLVELRHDIVTLLAPFDIEQATAAIRKLRIARLFEGYRDMPPLDLEALAGAAVALGNFACAAGSRLLSVDLNPVMVMARGQGVVAVDAVVELEEKQ